mgnify:CR=1 FL=1
MKHFAAILLAAILSSCASSPEYLEGDVASDKLLNNVLFSQPYSAYQVSKNELDMLASLPDTLSISVFFGEWCGDSQREVPVVIKSFESKPAISLTLIALDMNKKEPKGRAAVGKVKFTPTMIIYNKGIEIGRIVERPKINWISHITDIYRADTNLSNP